MVLKILIINTVLVEPFRLIQKVVSRNTYMDSVVHNSRDRVMGCDVNGSNYRGSGNHGSGYGIVMMMVVSCVVCNCSDGSADDHAGGNGVVVTVVHYSEKG